MDALFVLPSIKTLIIVCPLVFLSGFIDSIAGGGGLVSLPAYMFAGLPVHAAIATNKVNASMGGCVAVYRYAKEGYIAWKLSLSCAALAFFAARAGAKLALLVSDSSFKIIMLLLLPIISAYVLRKKEWKEDSSSEINGRTWIYAMLATLAIGVYDGFYGPGTGTFLILALSGPAKMGLREANGTTKVINLTTAMSSCAVYLASGNTQLVLGLIAGCCAIFGNQLGANCFIEGGSKFTKPVIILVLIIFTAKLILELCGIM